LQALAIAIWQVQSIAVFASMPTTTVRRYTGRNPVVGPAVHTAAHTPRWRDIARPADRSHVPAARLVLGQRRRPRPSWRRPSRAVNQNRVFATSTSRERRPAVGQERLDLRKRIRIAIVLAQADLQHRKIDKAHARFLTALRTLAQVRKLALPTLQLNIARNQVNVAETRP
jgi:hypothetical protein